MSSAKVEREIVSVDDIAAISDAELVQFLQKHRLSNGDYDLPVDGWERLSENERSRLSARLEAQKGSLAQNMTSCSRPLDLDALDARLRQALPNSSFSLRPESQAICPLESPTLSLDLEIYRTKDEIEAYHGLINDGGRPLYPIELIQHVYRDPGKYAEILRPWQEHLTPISPSGIFQRQWQRWQDFRKWQNDNRGRDDDDDDGGFEAYIDRQKHMIQRDFLPRTRASLLAEIEADPSSLESEWDQKQFLRRRQRRLYREHGCRGFYGYARAVKHRLVSHSFTQPFELDEDPKKQHKLTTWIEYLNYEYWWLDKYISDIERLEPERDKLWQDLANKGILRPDETKESVLTATSGLQREVEKKEAMEAVQNAASEAERTYVLTQEDPKRWCIPKAERISRIKHHTEKLLAAKRWLEQVRSRSSLIVQFTRATFDYAGANRNATRHRTLVQWVLDQIPLIETEADLFEAKRPESCGRRGMKRRSIADQEPLERQSPKRVRFNLHERRSANATSPNTTETQPGPGRTMNQEAAQDAQLGNGQATSQTIRRSARIAARRSGSRISIRPDIVQPRVRTKTGKTSAKQNRREMSRAKA